MFWALGTVVLAWIQKPVRCQKQHWEAAVQPVMPCRLRLQLSRYFVLYLETRKHCLTTITRRQITKTAQSWVLQTAKIPLLHQLPKKLRQQLKADSAGQSPRLLLQPCS